MEEVSTRISISIHTQTNIQTLTHTDICTNILPVRLKTVRSMSYIWESWPMICGLWFCLKHVKYTYKWWHCFVIWNMNIMHITMYIYILILTYMCRYTHKEYIYIHIHYIYIHTCINTHTHTHSHSQYTHPSHLNISSPCFSKLETARDVPLMELCTDGNTNFARNL